jgi:multiple sugar transport system substrate-binding protein
MREEIQLVYQDWRTDWFPELVETTLAEFHERHPDIRVFFTPDPDNLADAMLADMQAGTAPDLFWGGSTFFTMWAQQGHLLDLRPYVAADLDEATISEWDPAQYRAFFLHSGEQFGLPKYHGAVALYYNKALFDAAGVAYPTAAWSYDDYLTAMGALSHTNREGVRDQWGSMVDITWDRLQIYVNAWGGHFVAPYDPAYCVIAAPAAQAALSWLRARIWEEHVMASFPDVQYMSPRSAFINGRVAMMEEGSWVLKDVLTNSDFPVGVAPLPQGPARHVSLASADGFGIFNETQYPEAAWTLLQFLTSATYGRALAEADFLQPARASLIDEWIGLIRAAFPAQAADLDLTAFVEGHRQGRSVTIETAEKMAEVEPKLMGAFEQIFTLGQTPVSTLTAVCTEINQLLQSSHQQQPHLAE